MYAQTNLLIKMRFLLCFVLWRYTNI